MKKTMPILSVAIVHIFISANASAAEPTKGKKRDVASISKKSNLVSCSFTEPFVSIEVNIKRKVMKVTAPMGELMDGKISTIRTDEIDGIATSDANGIFTFSYAGATDTPKIVLLTVDTKKKGSDGMSDKIFDAEGTTALYGSNLIGGCDFKR